MKRLFLLFLIGTSLIAEQKSYERKKDQILIYRKQPAFFEYLGGPLMLAGGGVVVNHKKKRAKYTPITLKIAGSICLVLGGYLIYDQYEAYAKRSKPYIILSPSGMWHEYYGAYKWGELDSVTVKAFTVETSSWPQEQSYLYLETKNDKHIEWDCSKIAVSAERLALLLKEVTQNEKVSHHSYTE